MPKNSAQKIASWQNDKTQKVQLIGATMKISGASVILTLLISQLTVKARFLWSEFAFLLVMYNRALHSFGRQNRTV